MIFCCQKETCRLAKEENPFESVFKKWNVVSGVFQNSLNLIEKFLKSLRIVSNNSSFLQGINGRYIQKNENTSKVDPETARLIEQIFLFDTQNNPEASEWTR